MDDMDDAPSRTEFLKVLWNDVINEPMTEAWIDYQVNRSAKWPNDPFADTGPLLQKLMKLGVSRRELSLLHRQASYAAVFLTLYKLGDPGCSDTKMLFEELLTADPSGLEGRPGSAPKQRG